MGAYILQADLEKRLTRDGLSQLTDDSGAGGVDADNMNQAIAEAEGEADGYLAKRYSVPLATPSAIVKALTTDICVYRLYLRRGAVPDHAWRQYEAAVKFFKSAAKAEVSLGADSEPTSSPNEGGPAADKTEDDRIFTKGRLDNY